MPNSPERQLFRIDVEIPFVIHKSDGNACELSEKGQVLIQRRVSEEYFSQLNEMSSMITANIQKISAKSLLVAETLNLLQNQISTIQNMIFNSELPETLGLPTKRVNISASGFSTIVHEHYDVDQLLCINLKIPNESPVFTYHVPDDPNELNKAKIMILNARVVRVNETPEGRMIAAEFIDLSDDHQRRLSKFILKQESQQIQEQKYGH